MTTITKEDAQMLATLACRIRQETPGARQWDPDKVQAQVGHMRHRTLLAVTCAVARCAGDRNAQREECLSSPGSHWGDTMLVTDWVPNWVPAEDRCSVCSKAERNCRATYGVDLRRAIEPHEFKSAAIAAREAAATTEATAGAIAALKDELAHRPRRPAPPDGLEALADRNPELRARVDHLRETVPGLAAPPQQHPTPGVAEEAR